MYLCSISQPRVQCSRRCGETDRNQWAQGSSLPWEGVWQSAGHQLQEDATVKIAADVGTHEGEGAKISTQSSLVTSRNTTSPLSLGTPSYGDTLPTSWALCCQQVGFPCVPLQHRFLKGHVRSSCIFKYAPVKPWEVFRSTIQRMYVSSKTAGRKIKLMG